MRKTCILKMYTYPVHILVLTSIGFQLILSSRPSLLRRKYPNIDVLRGHCRGHENAPVQFKNIHIARHRGVNYISGKLIVNQDNFTQFQVLLQTKRCTSKEALDTCESMQAATINNICTIFHQKNQVWSPFVNNIQPPLGCPTRKGTYIINNGTFDIGPLINLPGIDQWYWKEQAEMYQQDTKILAMCIIMEGQVVSV